jgi:hypothetical protein
MSIEEFRPYDEQGRKHGFWRVTHSGLFNIR